VDRIPEIENYEDQLDELIKQHQPTWCECKYADWKESFDGPDFPVKWTKEDVRDKWTKDSLPRCDEKGAFIVGLVRSRDNCGAHDVLGCLEGAVCCKLCYSDDSSSS
jgi:hypothetical protein